jgi:hypothetical protein
MAVPLRALRPGDPATITVPDPDAVPDDDLAALIVRLSALSARAAARLLTRPARPPDQLLTLDEAAARLRTTPDWLRRQKDLPFRIDVAPQQVRFSALGLDDWIAARRGTAT